MADAYSQRLTSYSKSDAATNATARSEGQYGLVLHGSPPVMRKETTSINDLRMHAASSKAHRLKRECGKEVA